MIDNSRVVLENGKEYLVIDKIKLEDKAFVYLSNKDDSEDFCVRKEVLEDEKAYLVGLDDKEEADYALKLFAENHKEN